MKMKYLRNSAQISIFQETCIGCKMCIEVCPHDVIHIQNNKAFIHDKDSCMECGACAMNCPVHAISVKAGVGCAWAVINAALGKKGGACECTCSCE